MGAFEIVSCVELGDRPGVEARIGSPMIDLIADNIAE